MAPLSDRTVTPRTAANNAATGRVILSGTATVGETITATVPDLADPDGLPTSDSYRFAWSSVEGSEQTTISASGPGPVRDTYTLTAAEAGKAKVADNQLPTDGAVLAVGPADVHEPETGTVPLVFRVCLWTEGKLCPDAGKDPEFEAYVGASHQVTVDYTTSDGTATAGQDYRATSGKLTFAPGETVKTVEVLVLADAHDEGIETVWLELSNPVGATLGRWRNFGQIHNQGPIPGAWISRFGRTVGSQVVEGLTQRLEAGEEPQVTVGG